MTMQLCLVLIKYPPLILLYFRFIEFSEIRNRLKIKLFSQRIPETGWDEKLFDSFTLFVSCAQGNLEIYGQFCTKVADERRL